MIHLSPIRRQNIRHNINEQQKLDPLILNRFGFL